MTKYLLALMFLAVGLMAQPPGGGFVYVTVAPSGSCAQNSTPRLLMPNGTIYTCQSGTWHSIGGSGGSGTVTSVATTAPIQGGTFTTSGTITCRTATGSVSGCLSAADWTTFNNKKAAGNYITALTGDGTAAGPNSAAMTLATVNGNVGTFGDSTHVGQFTVNAKGLITAAVAVAISGGGGSGCTTSGTGVQTGDGAGGCTNNAGVTISSNTLNATGGLSAGASPPSVTGTGVVALGETTGQACAAAAVDCLIADSAAHAIKASFNNGAASQVARYVDTLAVFAAGALASGTTATTQSADDNSTKVATTAYADRLHTRGIGFTLGDPTNSAALTTSYTSYVTVPFACTISAYNLLVDATDTTLRVKFWKVATGTAIPTVSNSISTSGLGVPSGTAVHSTTTSDFTSLAVTANDIVAMNVSVANTAKMVNGVLQCDQ